MNRKQRRSYKREAGISQMSERDREAMNEALVYGNLGLWREKAYTPFEYFEKRKFEIKALFYFLRKRLPLHNFKEHDFLQGEEYRKLSDLEHMSAAYIKLN